MRVPVRLRLLIGVCTLLVAGLLPAGALAAPSVHPFEIIPGSFSFTSSSGEAGAHGNWVTSFNFAHETGGSEATYNDVRNIVVEVPAGFDASDTAVPTCTPAQLLKQSPLAHNPQMPSCPLASQVGLLSIEISAGHSTPEQEIVPVFNMEVTSFGVTAELGYKTALFSGTVQIAARESDLGLTATTPDIPDVGEVHNIVFTVWGLPASHQHDAERGEFCENEGKGPAVCRNEFGGPQEAHIPVQPFLSNPTSCGSFAANMEADSWEEPFNYSHASTTVGPVAECGRVQFKPSLEVQPSTRAAESPSGLEVSLLVPQTWSNEGQFTTATSNLKETKVTLPEGMTANPGLAAGLGACTPAQYKAETSSSRPGEGCPPESKIGSITIETPLLNESVPGAIYIATPYDNPFPEEGHPHGSLLALYVVAKDPERGVLIKVAGHIQANHQTGQLVTTFGATPAFEGIPATAGTPQQPFSKFTLKFRPGATAPLISPPACGSYAVQGELTPWSAPEEPHFISGQPFVITQGVGGGACPSGGTPPFNPRVVSGTENSAGSSYSPFYLRLERQDGEQELTRFSTTLPPGLTGNLSGIPFCSEAEIQAARGRTGAEEEANPSCPAASEIGHTIVSAGVGTVLAQTPGKVYLAGPYNGAPFSIVSITSAKVGPFDLGTVVIRFALNINPVTAQVEVSGAQSEAIPRILEGIVVHVREIRVYMNRPNFTINPTNCTPMNITDTIDGAGANPNNPAGQDPVTVNTPFEATDCSSLKFEPKLTVTTQGKTSKADGASLTAKLTIPGGLGTQANIRKVKVDLPKQLPSRLTTLQKACTAAQFNANPAGCPAASVIGYAKANTPILPVPLEGPAYFVSHGGEAFPSLEIVLQGYGVRIDLTATTFISKAGITSSTFNAVPDQPVTSFELTLPEKPYSALAANGNLCSLTKTTTTKKKVTVRVKGHKKTETRNIKTTQPATLEMPTAFVGQNGAEKHQSTPITVTGCPKAAPAKKTKKQARRKRTKRAKK